MKKNSDPLEANHSISCPFCGGRSSIAVPVPVIKAKNWTQKCPHCEQTWKVKVWDRRGISQFSVSPVVDPKS